MANIELRAFDIGDLHDVEVIEILVTTGDTVAVDEGLISIETDKATMEIPSAEAGAITQLHLQVGDKISEGSLIATLEVSSTPAEDIQADVKSAPEPASASTLSSDGFHRGSVGMRYNYSTRLLNYMFYIYIFFGN